MASVEFELWRWVSKERVERERLTSKWGCIDKRSVWNLHVEPWSQHCLDTAGEDRWSMCAHCQAKWLLLSHSSSVTEVCSSGPGKPYCATENWRVSTEAKFPQFPSRCVQRNSQWLHTHIVFSGRFHSVIDVVYRKTLLLHNSRHRVLVDCKKKAMYSADSSSLRNPKLHTKHCYCFNLRVILFQENPLAHHKLTLVRYYEQEGHILFILFSVAIHVVGSTLFCHTQSCTECGGSVGFHRYCKLHFHSLL